MPQLVTPPHHTAALVEHALWWATFHHRVFPLCSPKWGAHTHYGKLKSGTYGEVPCPEKQWGKRPVSGFAWKRDATKDPATIERLWRQYPDANIGGTPDDGFVWLDKDTEDDAPVSFPDTFRQNTSQDYKYHLLYRQPEATERQIEQTQPGSQYWPGWDSRCANLGYVVLAPSTHYTGTQYRVANPVSPAAFPPTLIPELSSGEGKVRLRGVVDGHKTADREVVSLLTTIVETPGSDVLGNGTFAKLASRLAKTYAGDLPQFRAWLRVANAAVADPMPESDLAKMDGIWTKAEEVRLRELDAKVADGARGWLYEAGDVGYSTMLGTDANVELVPWSNFRVTAKSLVDYGDHQVWVVDFHKADGSVLENVELPSEILASTPSLRRFLVNRGMSLLAPSHDKRGNHGERLLCLLQSQDFERQTVIDHYGWDPALNAFVTPEHLITADSVTSAISYLKVRNDTLHYGFDEGAIAALREYLTFQDETCMSVMGAFLMATILRGHYTWQPPNLVVEAHAGSGKSTYLRMLGQFCGVRREPGAFTLPVARDAYALSSNIFNWFDDVPMGDKEQTLFRQSGTGGAYELKDMSRKDGSNKVVYLHASTVLTAERVTFMEQKAMADRFLAVAMPSADARKSTNHAERSQWWDVDKFFKHQHKSDLTKFAGTLVQLALRQVHLFDQLDQLTTSTTRPGQMAAIMRCGARVLSALTNDPTHTTRVDAWVSTFDFSVSPSLVTNSAIPRVWSHNNQPKSRYFGTFGLHSVFFNPEDKHFWVAPTKLAEQWVRLNPRMSDREADLTNSKAILMELKAIGAEQVGRRSSKDRGADGETQTYYRVPERYTDVIYHAATGGGSVDESM